MCIIIFLNIAKLFFFSLNLLFETIFEITYMYILVCIQSRRYYKKFVHASRYIDTIILLTELKLSDTD